MTDIVRAENPEAQTKGMDLPRFAERPGQPRASSRKPATGDYPTHEAAGFFTPPFRLRYAGLFQCTSILCGLHGHGGPFPERAVER